MLGKYVCQLDIVYTYTLACRAYTEPEEEPPVPSGRGGGLTLLRGRMLRMENFFFSFFNVFTIFVKIFVHNEIYR